MSELEDWKRRRPRLAKKRDELRGWGQRIEVNGEVFITYHHLGGACYWSRHDPHYVYGVAMSSLEQLMLDAMWEAQNGKA